MYEQLVDTMYDFIMCENIKKKRKMKTTIFMKTQNMNIKVINNEMHAAVVQISNTFEIAGPRKYLQQKKSHTCQ